MHFPIHTMAISAIVKQYMEITAVAAAATRY